MAALLVLLSTKKNKAEFKTNVKFSKSSTKEAMTISKVEPLRITGRPNLKEKRKSAPFKDMIRRRPTLIELQEEKYPLPNSALPRILDDLLEKGAI